MDECERVDTGGGVEPREAGTLSLGSAARLLAVSYRQAKRLARRHKAEGAKGLSTGARGARRIMRGRRPNRSVRWAPVREKYSGPVDVRFGPTLAAEHLASEDGVTVHHDTLRRWMLTAGLWSRARKRAPHRRRRERKAHFGELVQLDGSFHMWYEARSARLLDEPGRRCNGSDARAAGGTRKRSGRRPMCCAGGSKRMACRWRSIRIGKMCMCGCRMRRSR
jgi:transposase